jgi:hypothetical protein
LKSGRLVVAQPAAHIERPHAVRAHVAEGHGLDRIVEAGGRIVMEAVTYRVPWRYVFRRA